MEFNMDEENVVSLKKDKNQNFFKRIYSRVGPLPIVMAVLLIIIAVFAVVLSSLSGDGPVKPFNVNVEDVVWMRICIRDLDMYGDYTELYVEDSETDGLNELDSLKADIANPDDSKLFKGLDHVDLTEIDRNRVAFFINDITVQDRLLAVTDKEADLSKSDFVQIRMRDGSELTISMKSSYINYVDGLGILNNVKFVMTKDTKTYWKDNIISYFKDNYYKK